MSVREPQTDLQMDVEDALSDITADIMSVTRYEDILRQLFTRAAGQWFALKTLCQNDVKLLGHLTDLEKKAEGTLQVAWMDYPASENGGGYCTVVFFVERLHWHSLALYNKGRLERAS